MLYRAGDCVTPLSTAALTKSSSSSWLIGLSNTRWPRAEARANKSGEGEPVISGLQDVPVVLTLQP
jgi:hypothetical protein